VLVSCFSSRADKSIKQAYDNLVTRRLFNLVVAFTTDASVDSQSDEVSMPESMILPLMFYFQETPAAGCYSTTLIMTPVLEALAISLEHSNPTPDTHARLLQHLDSCTETKPDMKESVKSVLEELQRCDVLLVDSILKISHRVSYNVRSVKLSLVILSKICINESRSESFLSLFVVSCLQLQDAEGIGAVLPAQGISGD
jgi:hypothetical protein